MTPILPLALALGAPQQPQPRRRAEPVTRSPANLAPAPNGAVPLQGPPPRTAYDSPLAAIVSDGHAVPDVQPELDRLQMKAQENACVAALESIAALSGKCPDLPAEAALRPW